MLSTVERIRKLLAALLPIVASIALALPARACPNCRAGSAARTEIFGDHFFRHLAVAVLPFLIVGAVCRFAQDLGRPRA